MKPIKHGGNDLLKYGHLTTCQRPADPWRPFGLTVEHALNRGDDPALLFDENSPIRGELRRLLREGSEPKAETRQRLGAEPAEPGPKDAPNNRSTPGSAPTGEALTDEQIDRITAEAMLTVDDPLAWGRLGPGNGDMLRQIGRSIVRAALSTHPSAPVAPAGFALVAVRGLDDLMDALERADRKGYMPDAISDAWDAFNIAPLAATPSAEAQPTPKEI